MQELVKLVKENPDLPIVAMVNGDVCNDYGSAYWMADFTRVELAEVGIVNERFYDDRDSFKEAYYDKYDEELTKRFNYRPCLAIKAENFGGYTPEEIEANEIAETKLEAYLEERADEYMRKCIVVYIDVPDMSDWREA